jgi:PAS domain S-box-containing protein
MHKATLNLLEDIQEENEARKNSEQALKESEERFRSVAQSASDAIVTTNSKGIVIEWNRGAEKIFGYSKEEIKGKELSIIIPQKFVKKHKSGVKRNEKGGEKLLIGKTVELSALHKNGNEFPIELSLAEWETATGKFFTGIIRDITERRNAGEALRESEERYRTILTASPDAIFITDLKEGRHLMVSPGAVTMFGCEREEDLIGHLVTDFIVPEDRERAIHNVVLTSEGKGPGPIEYGGLRLDESRFVFEANGEIIHNADGEPIQMVSIVRNITERKQAAQALEASHKLLFKLSEQVPGVIYQYRLYPDGHSCFPYSSSGMQDIFEVSSDEVREDATIIFGRLHPDDLTRVSELIFDSARTLNRFYCEYRVILPRQGLRWRYSDALPERMDDGGTLWHGIIYDITDRKLSEAKLIHADRMANLGEMASGIAHEINQPLNIISLAMDNILFESARAENLDATFFKNKSDKIFNNITRIRNIIDHIRAFSRSNDDFILSAFDINVSIENAVTMLSEQFKQHEITLELHLQKQLPQILGNTYKFEQVMLNLLSNARDAVNEKKSKQNEYTELTIKINSFQEDQHIVVEVTDNGIGVRNEDIDNIMLPFYTTKETGKGTGLGLSICYQIINEMNGTLEIKSDLNQGTKVKVILTNQNFRKV